MKRDSPIFGNSRVATKPQTQSNTSKTVDTVAADFRKTAAGIQLGRMLFDPNFQGSISPAQIGALMRAAGLNVPNDVQVSIDAAQLIYAGGAFASAVETADDIGDLVNPTVAVIQAATTLLEDLHLIDMQAAELITLGTELALVISSWGTNVVADIALVISVVSDIFDAPDTRTYAQAVSQAQAKQFTAKYLYGLFKQQSSQAAVNFSAYQSGKLSVFQYIDSIAQESPMLFENYFPKLGVFLPPATVETVTGTAKNTAEHGGFIGLGESTTKETATFSAQYSQIEITPQALAQDLINGLILKPWAPYGWLNAACSNPALLSQYGYPPGCEKIGVKPHPLLPIPRLSIEDWAILSLIPPHLSQIGGSTDIRKVLKSYGVTPYDLGYDIFPAELARYEFINDGIQPPAPALAVNGVDYYTPQAVTNYQKQKAMEARLQKLIDMDRAGNIDGLLADPIGNALVAEFGVIPMLPPDIYRAAYGNNSDATKDYRNLKNYFAILSTANAIRTDPFFVKGPGVGPYTENTAGLEQTILDPTIPGFPPDSPTSAWYYMGNPKQNGDTVQDTGKHSFTPPANWNVNFQQLATIPTPDAFEKKHQDTLMRIVGRKLNAQALVNIASFFGTTPDKINVSKNSRGLLQVTLKGK